MGDNELIEVRQVQEFSEFPEDVKAATAEFDKSWSAEQQAKAQ